jgi:hypothetical protein
MATIHLVDGGIGSVGKSLFCRVLLQYCLDQQLQYQFIEADLDNPDVARTYPERVEVDAQGDRVSFCPAVSFHHPGSQYDPALILEAAIQHPDRPVIVNLPAQAFMPVNRWMEQQEVLVVAAAHDIEFCKWFLCNGRHDSVQLFLRSVNQFQGSVTHALVLNHYFRREWAGVLKQPTLEQVLNQNHVPVIHLPRLADDERDRIDQLQLSFGKARQFPQFTLTQQQRVAVFLRQTYSAIEQSQMLSRQPLNSIL